jgi:carboxylesterase type B
VLAHLASPGSRDLFHSAILQSPPLALGLHSRAQAAHSSTQLARVLGCGADDEDCLRSKPWEEIVEKSAQLPASPLLFAPLVEDGGEIPQQPLALLSSGKFDSNVRILAGFVRDEGVGFVHSAHPKEIETEDMQTFFVDTLGPGILPYMAFVKKSYPFVEDEDGRVTASAALTDYVFACPLLSASSKAAAHRPYAPLYIYQFVHALSSNSSGPSYCRGAVCHGSELGFVFANYDAPGTDYYPATKRERFLSNSMNRAWANFIRTGDPNVGGKISTPPFVPMNSYRMVTWLNISRHGKVAPYDHSLKCEFWDSYGYNFVSIHPFQ